MVHNQVTATKYYLLKNKGKSAVKTSKELSHNLCDLSRTAKASSEIEKDEDQQLHNSSLSDATVEGISGFKTTLPLNELLVAKPQHEASKCKRAKKSSVLGQHSETQGDMDGTPTSMTDPATETPQSEFPGTKSRLEMMS
ncbi:Hypothetical predicted protein [Paramuricea clavata]|uniref:Uncharacterized protein n=1 Tax=Paramuricea clavata TaxID=317549 RepID=A0A7D9I5X6_PARCT|nr:Hypothetical predicted protein [Paramuricea clavata]